MGMTTVTTTVTIMAMGTGTDGLVEFKKVHPLTPVRASSSKDGATATEPDEGLYYKDWSALGVIPVKTLVRAL